MGKIMGVYISHARLGSYRNILKLSSDNEIERAYYWNIALCAAILPVLNILEITFRNGLNHYIINEHSHYKDNKWWFRVIECEIQDRKFNRMPASERNRWVVEDRRMKKSKLEQDIDRIYQQLPRSRRTAENVLSRLSFGNWTRFLDQDYMSSNRRIGLWPYMLQSVFPNGPQDFQLTDYHTRFDTIRKFRNRVFHHEPIWKFYNKDANGQDIYGRPVYGVNAALNILRKHYDEIIEAIQWISENAYNKLIHYNLHAEFEHLSSHEGFTAYVKY